MNSAPQVTLVSVTTSVSKWLMRLAHQDTMEIHLEGWNVGPAHVQEHQKGTPQNAGLTTIIRFNACVQLAMEDLGVNSVLQDTSATLPALLV